MPLQDKNKLSKPTAKYWQSASKSPLRNNRPESAPSPRRPKPVLDPIELDERPDPIDGIKVSAVKIPPILKKTSVSTPNLGKRQLENTRNWSNPLDTAPLSDPSNLQRPSVLESATRTSTLEGIALRSVLLTQIEPRLSTNSAATGRVLKKYVRRPDRESTRDRTGPLKREPTMIRNRAPWGSRPGAQLQSKSTVKDTPKDSKTDSADVMAEPVEPAKADEDEFDINPALIRLISHKSLRAEDEVPVIELKPGSVILSEMSDLDPEFLQLVKQAEDVQEAPNVIEHADGTLAKPLDEAEDAGSQSLSSSPSPPANDSAGSQSTSASHIRVSAVNVQPELFSETSSGKNAASLKSEQGSRLSMQGSSVSSSNKSSKKSLNDQKLPPKRTTMAKKGHRKKTALLKPNPAQPQATQSRNELAVTISESAETRPKSPGTESGSESSETSDTSSVNSEELEDQIIQEQQALTTKNDQSALELCKASPASSNSLDMQDKKKADRETAMRNNPLLKLNLSQYNLFSSTAGAFRGPGDVYYKFVLGGKSVRPGAKRQRNRKLADIDMGRMDEILVDKTRTHATLWNHKSVSKLREKQKEYINDTINEKVAKLEQMRAYIITTVYALNSHKTLLAQLMQQNTFLSDEYHRVKKEANEKVSLTLSKNEEVIGCPNS
ncbi:hypothetical protein HDU91_005615 [Kappamyces sp. JEL0680]|nr:hypothetical protein HDU91_005615 [Kappamyces sp. JEL0680]